MLCWGTVCVLGAICVLCTMCASIVLGYLAWWTWGCMGRQVGSRSAGPHNLALEVGDGQGEVDVEHVVTLGHQQLQGEAIALVFHELPHRFLGGQRGAGQPGQSEICPHWSSWTLPGLCPGERPSLATRLSTDSASPSTWPLLLWPVLHLPNPKLHS